MSRSRTTSSVHLSPRRSNAHAIGQTERLNDVFDMDALLLLRGFIMSRLASDPTDLQFNSLHPNGAAKLAEWRMSGRSVQPALALNVPLIIVVCAWGRRSTPAAATAPTPA